MALYQIFTQALWWIEPNFKSNNTLEYCQRPLLLCPFTCSLHLKVMISCRASKAADGKMQSAPPPVTWRRSLRSTHLNVNLKWWIIESGGQAFTSCRSCYISTKTSLLRFLPCFQHHGQFSGSRPVPCAVFSLWYVSQRPPSVLHTYVYINLSDSLTSHFPLSCSMHVTLIS